MSKNKSIVTDYAGICFFCGKPAECEHHLLFGNGIRELAEQDGLKVPNVISVITWGNRLNAYMRISWLKSYLKCWGRQYMKTRLERGKNLESVTVNRIYRRRTWH